ncbi:MAG: outer membrane lipoprotein LolB [Gammaproteobacteria bacterium]|jgi:outer membrane lipoprotein LolB|nr:outer membrane lipoprotein LolB [Gammaproteobacteria bacterium]MBQ0773482.1 outer membrane lipoprotein LolB [Gammaproteobacteria bacterium]
MACKPLFRALSLSALILLSGCQALRGTHEIGSTPAALTDWNLDGRFGYRAGNDGGSASVKWEQRNEQGALHFSGPLGIGSARISWSPGHAELDNGKEILTATSTTELAWRLTGLDLPVEALQFWVRGLPWPDASARPIFDQTGTLTSLDQAGWQIRFDRYQAVDGLQLPARIRAQHLDQRFTLIVKNWEPLP